MSWAMVALNSAISAADETRSSFRLPSVEELGACVMLARCQHHSGTIPRVPPLLTIVV